MPAWIHDRARHLQAKNPDMSEQAAFAIATQQAHKLGKTPKGYGTAEGKKTAKSKFTSPRKSYVQTADPKGIGEKMNKAASAKLYHGDVEQDTLKNNNYRKVLFTGKQAQLVVMSIPPGADIGMETHPSVDQFFRIESGEGKAVIDGTEYPLKNATGLIIPSGSEHNIFSMGKEPLKLYTIYSPPNHPPGTIQATKADQPMEKKADEEENEVEKEPTEEQKDKIRDFILENYITNDDEFHKFVEGIGVTPHNAEPIVYQMANESQKTAEEHSSANKSLDLARLEGFSDEFYKLAMKDKLAAGTWKAMKSFLDVARGNPKLKWSMSALKNPKTRGDTMKMMAAQTAVLGGAGVGAGVGAKKIKEKHQKRLGSAYMMGARDMYGRLYQNALRRAQSPKSGSKA